MDHEEGRAHPGSHRRHVEPGPGEPDPPLAPDPRAVHHLRPRAQGPAERRGKGGRVGGRCEEDEAVRRDAEGRGKGCGRGAHRVRDDRVGRALARHHGAERAGEVRHRAEPPVRRAVAWRIPGHHRAPGLEERPHERAKPPAAAAPPVREVDHGPSAPAPAHHGALADGEDEPLARGEEGLGLRRVGAPRGGEEEPLGRPRGERGRDGLDGPEAVPDHGGNAGPLSVA